MEGIVGVPSLLLVSLIALPPLPSPPLPSPPLGSGYLPVECFCMHMDWVLGCHSNYLEAIHAHTSLKLFTSFSFFFQCCKATQTCANTLLLERTQNTYTHTHTHTHAYPSIHSFIHIHSLLHVNPLPANFFVTAETKTQNKHKTYMADWAPVNKEILQPTHRAFEWVSIIFFKPVVTVLWQVCVCVWKANWLV